MVSRNYGVAQSGIWGPYAEASSFETSAIVVEVFCKRHGTGGGTNDKAHSVMVVENAGHGEGLWMGHAVNMPPTSESAQLFSKGTAAHLHTSTPTSNCD